VGDIAGKHGACIPDELAGAEVHAVDAEFYKGGG